MSILSGKFKSEEDEKREDLDLRPLSIKSFGRAPLACQRCRMHKIKCSKGK